MVVEEGKFCRGSGKAHELSQTREGEYAYDLVHALVHWIEGDAANTAFWYRQVGGEYAANIEAEWNRIVAALSTQTNAKG